MKRIGAICWLLAAAALLGAQLVAQTGWHGTYSWANNNISDLGNVTCGPWGDNHRYVCSPLHAWLNASMILYGALLASGAFLLRLTPLVAAAAGWIIAGVVPADVNENLHVLGAVLIIAAGNGGLILVLRSRLPSPLRMSAVVAGSSGLVAMVLFLSGHYLGLGMGGMERVAAFALPVWTIAAALHALMSSRADER